MAYTPPPTPEPRPAVDPLPISAEHVAVALAAVVLAMASIQPDTREQAQRLHAGYLTIQGVPQADIDTHWAQFGGKYTG